MNCKTNILKQSIRAFAAVALMSAATGCVDEIHPGSEKGDPGKLAEAEALVFDISLSPLSENSGLSGMLDHGEDWESYIDPAKFRVLFFDREGNYIFEADRRYMTVISKDNKWTGSTETYRVTIPQKDLRQSMPGDAPTEVIQDVLMNKGFKVAVLANWPTFVEDVKQYDFETGDPLLTASTWPTNLDFVFDEAHYANREVRALENSRIEYLSHCIYDNVYGALGNENPSTENPGDLKYSAYKHLVDYNDDYTKGGRMGVYSSWVSYLYKSQSDAATFIRRGVDYDGDAVEGDVTFTYSCSGEGESFTYTPYSYTRTVDESNVYSLENIWRLWNFSAGEPDICPYHSLNGNIKNKYNLTVNEYWKARNENDLIYHLTTPEKYDDATGSYLYKDGFDVVSLSSSNTQGIRYYPVDGKNGGYLLFPTAIDRDVSMKTVTDNLSNSTNRKHMDTFEDNSLTFKAYGEGTLRIRCRAVDENHDPEDLDAPRLVVVTAIPGSANSEKLQYFTYRDEKGISKTSEDYRYFPYRAGRHAAVTHATPFEQGKEYEQSVEYIIDPSSEQYLDVYIGAIGGDMEIYEIEYMRARHIYDSARNSIMPSLTNPIPMYGVQNFDPIADYIVPDETFNMSDENENHYLAAYPDLKRYNYRNVFLLRSLAKVEIRFKQDVFKNNMPEHVMMRVMNRTARCEPKDVVNPTEWIWYGYNPTQEDFPESNGNFPGQWEGIQEAISSKFVGAVNEFKNICSYGPNYNAGATDVQAYLNRTSWFYGAWIDGDESLDKSVSNQFFWETPWNWGTDNPGYTGDQMLKNIEVPKTEYPYPRIFNSRVDRSDYCRFHRVPNKTIGGTTYICYVMYVPEKNIDDADNIGKLSAKPKVEHMELRFEGMNDVMNFDDNDCYRIYFTDYSENNGINGKYMKGIDRDGRNNFDEFEKNIDFLNRLQPIMRNCHYIFTVNSINNEQIGVNFSVCGAASRNGQPITFK